jgi:hypothetical protein
VAANVLHPGVDGDGNHPQESRGGQNADHRRQTKVAEEYAKRLHQHLHQEQGNVEQEQGNVEQERLDGVEANKMGYAGVADHQEQESQKHPHSQPARGQGHQTKQRRKNGDQPWQRLKQPRGQKAQGQSRYQRQKVGKGSPQPIDGSDVAAPGHNPSIPIGAMVTGAGLSVRFQDPHQLKIQREKATPKPWAYCSRWIWVAQRAWPQAGFCFPVSRKTRGQKVQGERSDESRLI